MVLFLRIPELYKQKSWQILLVGISIGSIISWSLFLYFYGQLQDKQLIKIHELQAEVRSLKSDKEILIEDIKNSNKEKLDSMELQDIKIEILNSEKFHLTTFSEYKLAQQIRNEINSLLAKDIKGIEESMEIIINSIENNHYQIDKNNIKVKVTRFALTTTLKIKIEIIESKQN